MMYSICSNPEYYGDDLSDEGGEEIAERLADDLSILFPDVEFEIVFDTLSQHGVDSVLRDTIGDAIAELLSKNNYYQ